MQGEEGSDETRLCLLRARTLPAPPGTGLWTQMGGSAGCGGRVQPGAALGSLSPGPEATLCVCKRTTSFVCLLYSFPSH